MPGMDGAGNIDVLEPIVRHSPAAEDADDLFGYSVTLHQIRVPSNFQEALESTRYTKKNPLPVTSGVATSQVIPHSLYLLLYKWARDARCARFWNWFVKDEVLRIYLNFFSRVDGVVLCPL